MLEEETEAHLKSLSEVAEQQPQPESTETEVNAPAIVHF